MGKVRTNQASQLRRMVMKNMRRTLASMLAIGMLGLSGLPAGAFAATATVKWAEPTQREDGKAMAATEIAGYEIQYKLSTDAAFKVVEITGNATTATIPNLVAVTATTRYEFKIRVTDTAGLSSSFVQLTPVTYNPPKGITAGTYMITP